MLKEQEKAYPSTCGPSFPEIQPLNGVDTLFQGTLNLKTPYSFPNFFRAALSKSLTR